MRLRAVAVLALSGVILSGCATQSGGISNCFMCSVKTSDNRMGNTDPEPAARQPTNLLATIAGALFARR